MKDAKFAYVSPNEMKWDGEKFIVVPYTTQIEHWNAVLQKNIYGESTAARQHGDDDE